MLSIISKKQINIIVWIQLSALPDFSGDLAVGSLTEPNYDLRCFAFWGLNVRKLTSTVQIFKLKAKKQPDLE